MHGGNFTKEILHKNVSRVSPLKRVKSVVLNSCILDTWNDPVIDPYLTLTMRLYSNQDIQTTAISGVEYSARRDFQHHLQLFLRFSGILGWHLPRDERMRSLSRTHQQEHRWVELKINTLFNNFLKLMPNVTSYNLKMIKNFWTLTCIYVFKMLYRDRLNTESQIRTYRFL